MFARNFLLAFFLVFRQFHFTFEGISMNSKYVCFAVLSLIALPNLAVGGELNVQGGSSTGGGQTTIVGSAFGLCRFSVTGAFNDVASAQLGPTGGYTVIASWSIRELATLPAWQLAPLVRYSVEQLPDGQTRVLLGVQSAHPSFNGGNVSLYRGSALIDADPVIIR